MALPAAPSCTASSPRPPVPSLPAPDVVGFSDSLTDLVTNASPTLGGGDSMGRRSQSLGSTLGGLTTASSSKTERTGRSASPWRAGTISGTRPKFR
jgi:hypothetical protein